MREGMGEMREGIIHHSYHLTAEYIWKLEVGTVLKTKRGRRKGREKKRGKGEVMKRSREKGISRYI